MAPGSSRQLAPARHQLDAPQPSTTPNTNPSVTSWSTNSHHTKSLVGAERRGEGEHRRQREAVVEPDSRFSEWRTRRGTRGFVTTEEESTGSVGDSSAPEQAGLEPAEADDPVRDDRDQRAGDRHRERELAERQVPRLLEHLRLDLEAVAEQDHDQRDDREVVHEARARVELEHLQPALAEREAGQRRTAPRATGTTAARARRRARPAISRPPRTSSTISQRSPG